ncbi:hypothetical protein QBC39DRAFT_36548 [Podospora conica]|nr:hypothetical protein QBC39DRAFT_36548 [Schizothecium conicum]
MLDARPFVIAVVGKTGSGKTTFTSLASGRTDLKIGHDLITCTSKPNVVPFSFEGRPVTLIDMPWFGDSYRKPSWGHKSDRWGTKSKVDVLGELAAYFAAWYSKGMLIDAFIFLHAADTTMLSNHSEEGIGLLEKMLGESAYERVAVVSTQWDQVTDPALSTELMTRRTLPGGVWHPLCNGGAVVLHHDNTKPSADNIVRHLVNRFSSQQTQWPLLMQQELREHKGKVSRTSAGKELDRQYAEAVDRLEDLAEEAKLRGPTAQQLKKLQEAKERRRKLLKTVVSCVSVSTHPGHPPPNLSCVASYKLMSFFIVRWKSRRRAFRS